MSKVSLKGFRKIYKNGFEAVKGINLDINDGEFMVLVGPSGCAKSTTLRMIAGLEEITSGDLYIGDKNVNSLPPSDRNIAMVFQDYALYPHMTIYDNMAYGLKIRRFSKKEIDRRVKKASEILGLETQLYKKPKSLSGGQRQRVAVGRTIVREPEVFLFDEPLSNLDAKLRVHMRAEIIKIQKKLKTTMVYVTHDQVEAMTMGDRICVMNEGEIMQVDEPLNIYEKPANKFVATFIGSPSMNILKGKLVCEDSSCFFEWNNHKILIPAEKADNLKDYINSEIELGLRPEYIQPVEDEKETNNVEGVVSLIELMGNEIVVHFDIEGAALISRTNPHSPVELEKKALFNLEIENAVYFDPETQKALNV
ncbi:MAG: ABC transporter ATP-binding protein [Candidatus Muiribacteriota bacterium]